MQGPKRLLGPKGSPRLTACKEMVTLVLKLQGNYILPIFSVSLEVDASQSYRDEVSSLRSRETPSRETSGINSSSDLENREVKSLCYFKLLTLW